MQDFCGSEKVVPRNVDHKMWIRFFIHHKKCKKCGKKSDFSFKKNVDQKMQTQKNADQKMQEQNCVFAIFLKNADPNNTKKDWTSQTRLILRLQKLTNNEHFDTDKMAASC